MNNQITAADVQRQLDQLDREFASPENCKSGRLKLDEFAKRRAALLKRLRDQENAPPAPQAAQSQRAAPSARPFFMDTDDAKRLRKLELALDAALTADDADAALEILKSEDFLRLLYLDELEDAAELGAAAFAAGLGARIALAMRHISLAGVRRRTLEARVDALENAIPKYRGTHKAGEHYPQNSIVTHSGALWIALKDTQDKPPSDSWQLCVQKGRDAAR